MNRFPTTDSKKRLAIVMLAPSSLEGAGYSLLQAALQQHAVRLSDCFVGFISRDATYSLDFKSSEFEECMAQLKEDLNKFQPYCVLYLGETVLKAVRVFHSIGTYRGSLFRDTFGYKALASHDPKSLMKNWDATPLFSFDVAKAVKQSEFPELKLPHRALRAMMNAAECIDSLKSIPKGTMVSIDIEGGIPNPTATKPEYRFSQGVTCLSISTDPASGFIIPLKDFSTETKCQVLLALASVLCDPAYPKVLQNGLYDWFVLAWHLKLPIRNIAWDTMISGWELYPELPKGLATQTTLYTDEPYYKFERKIDDDLTHYMYCCKDSAVTLEIQQKHEQLMTPGQREHFEFNMSLMPSLQFMMLKGIKYNKPASDLRKNELLAEMAEIQLMCNSLVGREINMNSPKQMTELIYRDLGCQPIYAKEGGRNTNRLTANADALLKTLVKQGANAHPFILHSLIWKKLEGARKQLEIDLDKDGRVRCSYNCVGTETGRLSCQGSSTGSGTNLQTIMESNRKFYEPDEGCYFFQCDLSGADGWTVAVHCAEQGDPTMLDDYYAGLKPAKIIAAMQTHGAEINRLDRQALKKFLKENPIPDEVYAASKAVQHGSNYGMKPQRMSENILEKSFKKSDDHKLVWIPPALCGQLQQLYFMRYRGVLLWQASVRRQIDTTATLPSASGHVRTFFGRPRDDATYRLAYAHEPQQNTTYATNLAMRALWRDPENRTSDNRLIIQPLHSVHDALCGQLPIERAEWAVEKIKHYFNNSIRIGNTSIVIPFEGGAGQSWYHTKEGNRIVQI
jgi:DNA polymerase I-like protein with 3'-5' exonuclease and polymerase domains